MIAWLYVLLALSLTVGLSLLLRCLFARLYEYRAELVTFLVVPPAFNDKALIANEALLSSLHSLGSNRSITERLFGRKNRFCLEIVSSKDKGIRFYVSCLKQQEQSLKKLVEAHLPHAKVEKAATTLNDKSRVVLIKQSSHYAFPIKNITSLDDHDPLGYVTAAMANIDENEELRLQLVCSPVHLRSADKIRNKILHNESFMPGDITTKRGGTWALSLVNKLTFAVADIFSASYHQDTTNYSVTSAQRDLEYKKQIARGDRPVRTLSYFEHEVVESVNKKLKEPIFETTIRVIIYVPTKHRLRLHRQAMLSALGVYSVPKYQSLKYVRSVVTRKKLRVLQAQKQGLSLTKNSFLSSGELASLFHAPHSYSAPTDNVLKSLSKTLPAPISLKTNDRKGVVIGNNLHHGVETPITITSEERQRHMYILGGTGNGKTTLLKYQIIQDLQAGHGLAVVDPHGDLAEELLGHIPESRLDDVIYLNPDDLDHPIGINLLELPDGLSDSEELREKDLVTESTVSVLRKIFSEDDSGGHRIEYILRNTIHTALTLPEANLFTIFRLLNDTKFRKTVVKQLEDDDLRNFWKEELGKAGEMQKVKMAAGITAKIGRFLFSASARGILEQNKSTINFESLMDENKILICNVSKGLLGEDTSSLFGITILAKLQLASLRRARQHSSIRKPFYLYVDEFQNFATMSFVQMLSEARKYKLLLIMAEQSTQQQSDQQLVEVILANVGTVVAFRSGSPTDERLILPLYKPYVSEGEIANLPAYNFYIRIAAQNSQEPMSGVTLLGEESFDLSIANTVKNLSRKKYGRKKIQSKDKPKPDLIKKGTSTKPRSLIKAKKEIGAI